MDTAIQHFRPNFYESEEPSYVPNEQAFQLFHRLNEPQPSALPSHFHNHPPFQDSNSSLSQLFRNNGNSIQQSHILAPESHHGYMGYQDLQSPMGASHQQPAFNDGSVAAAQQAANLQKQDDSESACRPRLTPEQTRFLEDYFAHTPRPTTNQKKRHANELGLTHEKVNVGQHAVLGDIVAC
ncbi:MAG: homeobox domain-containing protein [Janthinobacterium lividum]